MRPVKVRVVVAPDGGVCAAPSRYGVSRYPVIGLPLAAGAAQVSVALVTPAVAVGVAGARAARVGVGAAVATPASRR